MLADGKGNNKDLLLSAGVLLIMAALVYLPVLRVTRTAFSAGFVGLLTLANAIPALLTPRLWGFICLGVILACICAYWRAPVGHTVRYTAGFMIAGVLGLVVLWGISQGDDPLAKTLRQYSKSKSPSMVTLTPEDVASLRTDPGVASRDVVWKNNMLVKGLSGDFIIQNKCESAQSDFAKNADARERYLLLVNGKLSVPGKPVACERWKLNNLVLTYRTKYPPGIFQNFRNGLFRILPTPSQNTRVF